MLLTLNSQKRAIVNIWELHKNTYSNYFALPILQQLCDRKKPINYFTAFELPSSTCPWVTARVDYIAHTKVRVWILVAIATMWSSHKKSSTISIAITNTIVAA